MLKNFFVVCDHPQIKDQIWEEVRSCFPHLKIEDAGEKPEFLCFLFSSPDFYAGGTEFSAGIFYNISGMNNLAGSPDMGLQCLDFAANHPDCIVNYHYSEECFALRNFEMNRKGYPNLHVQASVDAQGVVGDLVRVIKQRAIKEFERHIAEVDLNEPCGTLMT